MHKQSWVGTPPGECLLRRPRKNWQDDIKLYPGTDIGAGLGGTTILVAPSIQAAAGSTVHP
jgi:hypothetical protein